MINNLIRNLLISNLIIFVQRKQIIEIAIQTRNAGFNIFQLFKNILPLTLSKRN